MKYSIGDKVNVRYKLYDRGMAVPSIIKGTRVIQLDNRIMSSVSYLCSPVESEGFEHDDEEWVTIYDQLVYSSLRCVPYITEDLAGSIAVVCEYCCKIPTPPPNYCGMCGYKLK